MRMIYMVFNNMIIESKKKSNIIKNKINFTGNKYNNNREIYLKKKISSNIIILTLKKQQKY